jgi:CHAD domain-containing protein
VAPIAIRGDGTYSGVEMTLSRGNVRKPILELRKSLRNLPANMPAAEVHNLRTRSRRVEAIAVTLAPSGKRTTGKLLKSLKPLRKAAGKVRDMDVLERKALSLAGHCRRSSVERLVEYLITMRIEAAHTLQGVVNKNSKHVRRQLKGFLDQIEKELRSESRQSGRATKVAEELSHWPEFDANNLHDFRIRVKELRYILQLAEQADVEVVRALDQVKSRIGDWHDWQELHAVAHKLLDPRKDRATIEKIAEIEGKKFVRALKAARTLKTRYLGVHGSGMAAEP